MQPSVCGYAGRGSGGLRIALFAGVLAAALATVDGQAAPPGATPVLSPACGSLEYGGLGTAESLIVSDLPLRGASSNRSQQMNQAIRLVLKTAGWRAGERHVGFPACDDSEPG